MADVLARATEWLSDQRRTHLSSSVTYRRGLTQAAMPATLATSTYEVVDVNGAIVKAHAIDFIVFVSDLENAGLGEPRLGDVIIVISGAEAMQYEVLQLPGSNHYHSHDPYGNAWRIHTKLTGPCEGL